MQDQLQQKAQELAALEAARLHDMTQKLEPRFRLNITNTPPLNQEDLWSQIGTTALNDTVPYSFCQQYVNISYVISHTFELPLTKEWDPVLTELQLRSAELLFDFGLYLMSIANAQEVLKRHPDNTRAGRVVKDVRALSQ